MVGEMGRKIIKRKEEEKRRDEWMREWSNMKKRRRQNKLLDKMCGGEGKRKW